MLNRIYEIATHILAQNPDPAVRVRLLRDVMNASDKTIAPAQAELKSSQWIQQLEDTQWVDGSWRRLHSRDTQAHQKIPTTEYGVERALALGLDATHPILQKAADYLITLLEGKNIPLDPPERNALWNTGVQLFTATTLALIQPNHPILDPIWQKWFEIPQLTFASGSYDHKAEKDAHLRLNGIDITGHPYLFIYSKYVLMLLSARPDDLPQRLENDLLQWLWAKADGIGYLSQAMTADFRAMQPGPLDLWFRSMELLMRFPNWPMFAASQIARLWQSQDEQGLWDFGPHSTVSIALPLSENWRKPNARRFDWSTRVLVLMARYYRA